MKIFDVNGDHAELPDQSNYNNLVCCGNVSGLSNACSGNFQAVAKLSDITNAHVEESGQSNYSNDVCLSEDAGGSVSVGYQAGDCVGFDTTVASISGVTNAHIGDANAYPLKICASASASIQQNTGSGSGSVLGPTPSLARELADRAARVAALPSPVHSLVKLACPKGAGVNDPCRTVYYLGADGYRHVFPNPKVYFSWFCDFSLVKIISPESLASVPLGKNVTYRPGLKMVKSSTSPTVYAVQKGGVLRAITSEGLARELYGADWNTHIDDMSEIFYSNYAFGTPLMAAAAFDPPSESDSVTYPSDNFGLAGYAQETTGTVFFCPTK